jgi:hypothetical protein
METKHECTNHTLPTPFHYKSPNTITITIYVRVIKPNTFTRTVLKNHDTSPNNGSYHLDNELVMMNNKI